ncbi:PSD1 and planctomycete cytochrome C domain-containing protein [Spirosoma luteolum]
MRAFTAQLVVVALLTGQLGWLSACTESVEAPADVTAASAQLPETIDYNLHVKPILSDRCFACHGPDQAKQQAGLRLDTPDGAYEALAQSGHTAIVPGKPARSELVRRILSTDPDEVMPTPKSNLVLTAGEKAILLKWVEQGAVYKPHWSLIAPTRPELPAVANQTWVRNDIDRFVLARQEQRHLSHAPEADRLTLLRRVSLDLTGLPPTPAEIDAFLADQSPNAYERVVDRLLRSPHYGERQAVDWLDLARYADTHGYQDDGLRTMWPYRDWVIRAYNQNLPFDRFVTWQLAGDLLPHPTQDMLMATAFNRNHQQSQEGGIVDEEYRVEYVADRTNTFGKAMLGLTVECARCHDHKYDPISQKDYYALFAFFNSNNDRGKIPYNGEAAPTITLTKAETEAKLRFIREKLTPLEQTLNPNRPDYQQRYSRWLATAAPDALAPDQGLIGHYSFDEPNRADIGAYVKAQNEARQRDDARRKKQATKPAASRPKPLTRTELEKDPRNAFANQVNDTLPARLGGDPDKVPYPVKGRFGMARYLPGDSQIELPGNFAAFEQNQPFTISSWFNLAKPGMAATLLGRTAGPMDGQRGYQLDLLPDGRLKLLFSHVWPDNAIDLETVERVPVKRWFQVAFAYDGSGKAAGVSLYLNGRSLPTRVLADHLIHSMVWGKGKTHWAQYPFMIARMHDDYFKDFAVDELRIYSRALTPLEIPRLAGRPDALTAALRTPATRRTSVQRSGLYQYYVTTLDTAYRTARTQALRLRGERLMLYNESDQVMVMHERKTPRPTYILNRGAYDAHGPRVDPATPAQLIALPDNLPRNRLGLAQWLLLPDHPLFSRVAVNRIWQQYFGQGLAKTSDDFGNQGSLPTHPELLDYLAVRFRQGADGVSPWNVKALHRLIVLSATYRQASRVSAGAREADPDNQWLTRGPSYRLPAEQVRDNALAASGLLVRQIGGPSVLPYQPAGIWEALATRNAVKYVQNHGDSLYRRSLYTIWKRSSPAPMMLNFDAAERHTCIVKRQKTSTPLQALVTLNDPQFVEAARVLAQRHSPTSPPAQIIDSFFRAVVSRPARPAEIDLMQRLYADELADFRRHPRRAADLLAVGEYPVDRTRDPHQLAAWTLVASTVLNFDEAIIKR